MFEVSIELRMKADTLPPTLNLNLVDGSPASAYLSSIGKVSHHPLFSRMVCSSEIDETLRPSRDEHEDEHRINFRLQI